MAEQTFDIQGIAITAKGPDAFGRVDFRITLPNGESKIGTTSQGANNALNALRGSAGPELEGAINAAANFLATRAADIEAEILAASKSVATAPEKTTASSQTAGDAVKPESDRTGTDTPVDEDSGEADDLTEEERQNLDNPIDPESTDENAPGENEDISSDITNNDSGESHGRAEDGSFYISTVGVGEVPTNELPDVVVTAKRIPTYVPVENPLHLYATYTYSISLFALSSDEYNRVMTGEVRWDRVGKCLIGGAGRFNSESSRHAAFRDDFYFDGLRLSTVVGMNARTKSTNAIEVSFNLIEPYGLTLLDRIIDLAETIKPACRNYLELPYALKIDFFGSTDEGDMPNPIPGMTKWLPIKLLELKMKVGTKGTEYELRAVPFNHQALQESTATTPINLEIDARTVQDFFDEGEAVVAETDELAAFREAVKLDVVRNDSAALQAYQARIKELEKGLKVKSSSYTAGVNAWYQYQIETGAREYTDRIRFVVDKDIADSTIVSPDRTDPSKTPVPDPGTAKARVANAPNASGPDFKSTAFSVSAGTSVTRLVDMVMRNSSYILDQVSDPATKSPEEIANKRGTPLNWYKIIPSIKLDKFDIKTNRWSRIITYYIKPYVVYNSKHPMGPQSRPQGFVKLYNYMYTGLNNDIIDFTIDFDTLFYTAIEVNRGSYQTISGAAKTTSQSKPNEIENPSRAGSIQQVQYLPIPDNPGASAALDGNRDPSTKTAASIQNSIYSGSRGDMLNLRLKIIGDPHFIKQDDIVVNPDDPDYDTKMSNQFSEYGSLILDAGEIYARVNFRTPVDINDNDGLLRSEGRYIESKFSGLYRILKVDSEFRSGRFEQTLDMIRIFDDILEAATDSESREIEDDPEGGTVDIRNIGETSSGVVVEDQSDTVQDDSYDDTGINDWGEENELGDPDTDTDPPSDMDTDIELEEISDGATADDIAPIGQFAPATADDIAPVKTVAQQDQIQAQADVSPATNDPVTGPVTTNREITQTVSVDQVSGGGSTVRRADTTEQPSQESLIRDIEYDIFAAKRSLSFFERRGNLAKVSELNSKLASLEAQLMAAQGGTE